MALVAALGGALFVAAAEEARAQTQAASPQGRPKVCLVLSGGGARGAAHVGVLKVLEELRVPVDCITGTSMGSLVGAGYATGTTIPEMEALLASMSTERLFKEKPPRQEVAIRRKQDDYINYIGPEFGFKGGELLLPKGVVSGVQLESVLRDLAKVKGYQNFDTLPIPFRAVATDLVTGKAVVFSEGELANVMRASMSVPGAVAPAEFGGMILVDGGLTNNLPVDVARKMGADIVIAVNLGTPLSPREELGSILGVSGQMINILTEQNVQASLASLKPTDILILPELGNFSAGDFDHLPATVPIGEAAARKVADRLAKLSLSPDEYKALRARQLKVAPPDVRPIDEIRFEGLKRVNPRAAAAIMDTAPGKPVDQAMLDRDMRRLQGTGDFEHVSYRYADEAGKRILVIDAVEKSWGPDYLRFGLNLSTDFKGDAYFNLLATHRMTWLNSLGAEWRNDLQVGRTSLIRTEFYQPLEERRFFFVAPWAKAERGFVDLFQGNDRIARYDVPNSQVGLDLGSQFTRYGELRAGVLRGTARPKLDTGPAYLAPDPEKVSEGAFTARLFFDQLDSVTFPRSGYGARINYYASRDELGADLSYTKVDGMADAAYSLGEHTFSLGLVGATRLGETPLPRSDQYQWGGFMQQSGYRTGALMGESIAFGRLVYYHRLVRQTLLEGVYAGFSLEAGKVGKPLVPGSPTGTLYSGSLFLALDSPVGPVYLAYGRADDGSSSAYLYLGRPQSAQTR
jgi:NTE family protein